MIRLAFISCLAVLTLAACSSREPVDTHAKASAGIPDIKVPAPSTMGEPHGPTIPATSEPKATATIPAALQGRWGLSPRDCAVGASRARDLLVITPRALLFHESHAVAATDVESDDHSISGNFAFTGKGRSWTKYEALKIGQRRLTRTEINPSASFSYAKCS